MENKNNKTDQLLSKKIFRGIFGLIILIVIVPALLFIFAGTTKWTMGWIYVIILTLSSVISRVIIFFKNPDLLKERGNFNRAEGTKHWDKGLVSILGIIGPIIAMIIAGLDHRYGWPPIVPTEIQWSAAAIILLGYSLTVWAMIENKFFSAVARIQKDRGHFVISSGPYSLVRHPGYAGALVSYIALPLMLDAFWVFIPSIFTMVIMVLRTKYEDKMLVDELEGYASYASKIRYRLFPGIW